MQLYRLTDHYGQALQEVLQNNTSLHPLEKQEDVLYAMLDGSMILTRTEQYKEVKLGRLFRGQDCLRLGDKQGKIIQSQYVSHFGDSKAFTAQMERVLEGYGSLKKRLIFITDGAVWMRNWIADAYPEAISILDFYHAKEYLCAVAKDYFEAEEMRRNWIAAMETLLLKSCTQQVIEAVKCLQQDKEMPSAAKLISYYTENIGRMDYAYYVTIGKGLIGSGAMESSHRTVIQCRMKRSGQRWSNAGAAHMLTLRTIKMNGQWEKVCQTITKQYHPNKAA